MVSLLVTRRIHRLLRPCPRRRLGYGGRRIVPFPGRTLTAILSAALAGVVLSGCTAAHHLARPVEVAETLTLTLRMDHRGAAPLEQLALARVEAERIYQSAHVRLVWRDAAGASPDRLPIVIVVVSGEEGERMLPGAAGISRLGLAIPGAQRAYIHYDRVRNVARTRSVFPGVLLGRVLAHELYHILARRHDHSRSGLMAAEIDPASTAPLSASEAGEFRGAVLRLFVARTDAS